jgi:hypothetical protein
MPIYVFDTFIFLLLLLVITLITVWLIQQIIKKKKKKKTLRFKHSNVQFQFQRTLKKKYLKQN